MPDTPRRYERKVKNAQEAHEAIRPAGDTFRTPGEVAGELSRDEFALYELVWKRTVASQMADARGRTATIRLGATGTDGRDAEFSASGTVITFRGFLAAYEEGRDDDVDPARRTTTSAACRSCPSATRSTSERLEATGHATSPPARYTQATLIKALEERGIGRPSTYASIMGTIVNRGYVFKKGSALVPSLAGVRRHRVAGEALRRSDRLRLHRRDGRGPRPDRERRGRPRRSGCTTSTSGPATSSAGLRALVEDLGEIDAREVNSIPIGSDIVLRVGRYGPYVERGEDAQASVPEDMAPDELTVEKAEELLAAPSGERELGTDPSTGLPVVAKVGRFGPYVTEVLADDAPKTAKPRTGSLFKTMSLDTVTLDDALRLLSLPRVVGTDPSTARRSPPRTVATGPYLKKGTDSRSIDSEEQLFDITLDEALAIYAQPKQRGRRAAVGARCASSAPIRRPGCRSWSRRAGSAPTSPTGRPTRRCAAATASSR